MDKCEPVQEGALEVTLDKMSPGESGIILAVTGSGAIRRRMLEIGLIEGTPLQVIKYAPLGDPIEICVGGTRICLRDNEAACVRMKKAEGEAKRV